MAEELCWEVNDFQRAFDELSSQQMVEADWNARLVWIPNALKHNPPESPNVVSSWGPYINNQLPECKLLDRAVRSIEDQLIQIGDPWISAFRVGDARVERPNQISKDIIRGVKNRDGDNCRYCGVVVKWHDRKSGIGGTFDHVNPSGPSSIENLVVSCRGCNCKKSIRTPEAAGMALINRKSIDDPLIIKGKSIYQEQEQEQDKSQKLPPTPQRGVRANSESRNGPTLWQMVCADLKSDMYTTEVVSGNLRGQPSAYDKYFRDSWLVEIADGDPAIVYLDHPQRALLAEGVKKFQKRLKTTFQKSAGANAEFVVVSGAAEASA